MMDKITISKDMIPAARLFCAVMAADFDDLIRVSEPPKLFFSAPQEKLQRISPGTVKRRMGRKIRRRQRIALVDVVQGWVTEAKLRSLGYIANPDPISCYYIHPNRDLINFRFHAKHFYS